MKDVDQTRPGKPARARPAGAPGVHQPLGATSAAAPPLNAPQASATTGSLQIQNVAEGKSRQGLLVGLSSLLWSMVAHLAILLTLGVLVFPKIAFIPPEPTLLNIIPEEDVREESRFLDEQNVVATEFTASASSSLSVGAQAIRQNNMAPVQLEGIPTKARFSTAVSIPGLENFGENHSQLLENVPVEAAGDARAIVDSYQQAMDRITQELLVMLADGPVLVIWCFDQSESMKDDQKEIRDRINRVYAELGLHQASQGDALTTAITSFGAGTALHTKRPTSDIALIRKAIDQVPIDPSGHERTFRAVGESIAYFTKYAKRSRRQMVVVLVSDESGDVDDNQRLLEQSIEIAREARSRVYVLGREAVFGYPYAHMRWKHPQTLRHHWLRIDRGPETAFVEQLQTDGFRRRHDSHGSGYGPYEQTRLAVETGGIFFLLPSVETNLVRGERRRYELEAMRSYKPDLRARVECLADITSRPLRGLVTGVIYDLNPYNKQISPHIELRVHFSPQFEAFRKQAIAEQVKARGYLSYLDKATQVMENQQKLRDEEGSYRWKANYDLMRAQLPAYTVRTYEYMAYLNQFVRSPKQAPYTKPPNLTLTHWDIRTRKERLTGELSQPYIDRANELLKKVIVDHPGTPWAARAQQELNRGYGVELVPRYYPPIPKYKGPLMPLPKL